VSKRNDKNRVFISGSHRLKTKVRPRTVGFDTDGSFSWDPVFVKTLSDDERLSIEELLRHGIVRNADVKTFQTITLHGHFGSAKEFNVRSSTPSMDENMPVQSSPSAVPASPPRMLEKFLWLTLPAGLRDAILGDAEESFNETLSKFGSIRLARWNYFKEVVYGVSGALLMLYARLEGKFKQRQ